MIYLEIGILLLFSSRFIVWKRAIPIFLTYINRRESDSKGKIISHRKAIFTSIGAQIGVGNIAGVATAVHLGGPGAIFWMWISAMLGMTFRMVAVHLSIKEQSTVDESSPLFASPFGYLERYLPRSWGWIPKAFAVLTILGGVIGANLIQSNSVSHALHGQFIFPNLIVALALTMLVAAVIIGGFQNIVKYCAAIAPWMVSLYLLAGFAIIVFNPGKAIEALGSIIYYAFTPYSVGGGVVAYSLQQTLQYGTARSVFSHASGTGMSTFLFTEDSKVSAYMAAITPIIDTLIICTTTGLVILIGMSWQWETGANLATLSFASSLGHIGQIIVVISLVIFAFTSIIAYYYFSQRCFEYLGGENILLFRTLYLVPTFMGPFLSVRFAWTLGDIITGLALLFHLVPLTYIFLFKRREIMAELSA
ncbi:MAG: sodium:alanine symporter family protein [Bdellovibrionales bacterium]|nr:sodium:alanine symporter family protein [Bdellovibrionales bacterium]MBT3526976.1 sodium:alanine symporter family protein [Bdellovibrionales bacterium]